MRASLEVGVNVAEGEVVMVLEEGAGGEGRVDIFASCVLQMGMDLVCVLILEL